jgi:hypothetical protein
MEILYIRLQCTVDTILIEYSIPFCLSEAIDLVVLLLLLQQSIRSALIVGMIVVILRQQGTSSMVISLYNQYDDYFLCFSQLCLVGLPFQLLFCDLSGEDA